MSCESSDYPSPSGREARSSSFRETRPPTSYRGKQHSSPARPPLRNPVAHGVPTGPVQVPPPSNKNINSIPVISEMIELDTWGTADLGIHKQELIPTFTPDAAPYLDLVRQVYVSLNCRYFAGMKHIPYALFQYCCILAWWYRVLYVHCHNGHPLSVNQSSFFDSLKMMNFIVLPQSIIQYLCSLGNFIQGSECYKLRAPPVQLGETHDVLTAKGWFQTDDANNRVTDACMWDMAMWPAPAVSAITVCNEANFNHSNVVACHNLAAISPVVANGTAVIPTPNILGWTNEAHPASHASWRFTYHQLGWSSRELARDTTSEFLLSCSTFAWLSERLATIVKLPTHPLSKCTLSVMGSPIQAYALAPADIAIEPDQRPAVAEASINTLKGTLTSHLRLESRFRLDARYVVPAFCFGYRLRRSRVFRRFQHGQPEYWNYSNYQPWLYIRNGNYLALTPAQMVHMNRSYEFGSQAQLNSSRFRTAEFPRARILSIGLNTRKVNEIT